jgi:hypothetical protein
MMIVWRGKNCSDGCPMYNCDMTADSGVVTISSPRCGVSGHKDIGTDRVYDIRLKMVGDGADAYCPKGDGCPFVNNLGLHLEIDNMEE